MLFITAILLIQLEPEERSETLDKRFSVMRTVHVRASKAKRTIYQTVHHCTNAQMLNHHGEAKWDDGAEEVG